MKKAILFDADGVLIEDVLYGVQYQKQSGISNEEMLPFYKGDFQDCLVGKADLKEVIVPWLKKWKWEGAADDFLKNWFEYEDKPKMDVIDFVKELKSQGIICCLATNQEKYRVQYLLENMGFVEIFDHFYTSAHLGLRKPDAEYFEYIYNDLNEKYGFSKEEIFFVDDTLENVEAGNAAGIDSFHFTYFGEFKEYVLSII